jgi:DNA-binding response OmpR family regulator
MMAGNDHLVSRCIQVPVGVFMDENTEAILLVDDQPEDLEMMSSNLREYGYVVFEAGNCHTALGIIHLHREIDLLLTDVSLPGTNGCELAKEILKINPAIKVLFVSAHIGTEVCRTYGLLVSDLHFLRKPFRPDDLILRVRAVLVSEEPMAVIGDEVKSDASGRQKSDGAA